MPKLNDILRDQVENLSPEWYEIKTKILTSTNVSAVLEYDIYKSKYDIFKKKVEAQNTLATSDAILWGLKYEPIARQLCMKKYGINISETGLKRHRDYPFLGATPDGLSEITINSFNSSNSSNSFNSFNSEFMLHEFKCVKSRQITRQIPISYWVQVQIAMEVWNIDKCLYSECAFQEYSNEADYHRDTGPHIKGILPVGTNMYIGPGPESESGIIKSDKPYYWTLVNSWDLVVHRNKEWFATVKPIIITFWKDVLTRQASLGLEPGFPIDNTSDSYRSRRRKRRRINRNVDEASTGNINIITNPYTYTEIDWSECIRANALSNFLKQDLLLDWLDMYGEDRGFQKDTTNQFQMQTFVYRQASRFKNSVSAFIKTKLDKMGLPYCEIDIYPELTQVSEPILFQYNYRSINFLNRTKAAIQRQVPVIFSGLLFHPEKKIYGVADMIIKEDLLDRIFPERFMDIVDDTGNENNDNNGGDNNGGDNNGGDNNRGGDEDDNEDETMEESHDTSGNYVAVFFKYATLELNSTGTNLLNCQKQKLYKIQSLILGETLQYLQPGIETRETSYILPRKLKCKKLGIESHNLERNLFKLDMRDSPYKQILENGIQWLNMVKTEGSNWMLSPENPTGNGIMNTLAERGYVNFMPNLNNRYDYPWHHTKKVIAKMTRDLTQILNLGIRHREILVNNYQITNWTQLTRDLVREVKIPGGDLVWKIIQINKYWDDACTNGIDSEDISESSFQKSLICTRDFNRESVRERGNVEFFIDFETVNDLYDDFSKVPEITGYDMIYLIGCVVVNNVTKNTQYHCFIADDLSSRSEKKMLKEFFNFLRLSLEENANNDTADVDPTAYMYHWTQAEKIHLDKAFDRYSIRGRVNYELIDLYKIFKDERIVVAEAFNYGLKNVAKAFYKHGFIKTTWKDGLTGAQASVGAWIAMDERKKISETISSTSSNSIASIKPVKLSETRTIQTLIDYNYNDCQVLYEMTDYLRTQ